MENNFSVDTSRQVKQDFLKKIRVPLGIALLLTGVETLAAAYFLVKGIPCAVWNEIGVSAFAERCLHYSSIVCIFVSLSALVFHAKPFSQTVTFCIRTISGLYFLGSFLFPRLPGFEAYYAVFSFGGFVLFDGSLLLKALLLWVSGMMIREGFSMQKDMEETI